MENAQLGGPYGMALLARYCVENDDNLTLEDFLDKEVFRDVDITTCEPEPQLAAGIDTYTEKFQALLGRVK